MFLMTLAGHPSVRVINDESEIVSRLEKNPDWVITEITVDRNGIPTLGDQVQMDAGTPVAVREHRVTLGSGLDQRDLGTVRKAE